MPCPHCAATVTTQMARRTTLSLSHVSLPRVPADVQRAHGHAVRPSAGCADRLVDPSPHSPENQGGSWMMTR